MSTPAVPRIAILDDYQSVALRAADWSPLGGKVTIDVFTDTILDEDKLVTRLQPYQIICAMRERTKFAASLIDCLPNLKFIATTGMVNRGIDIDYAAQKGITVSGTASKGNSTLEHIWAIILGTARYIAIEDENVKAGKQLWQTEVPMALAGKTLGLVGVGRLGAATARIAKAFGMNIIGWSPHLTPERAEAAGVMFCPTKAQLLQESDIVSVHMVLSPQTVDLINGEDFEAMKKSAFLINTSRGPIVNEKALIDALKERKIAGAGLDVFDIEPLPIDHELRKLKNVTLSPHLGYVSDDNYGAFWGNTVENIVAFLAGNPLRILK